MHAQPRPLADFQLTPGLIKQDYEDFLIEEIPLYHASGASTHTYFLLRKCGLSTMQALADTAQAPNLTWRRRPRRLS